MTLAPTFLSELLYASHKPSYECSQTVTNLLCDHLPIKAASFYSYFEETKILSLRAQTGLNYKDYRSFELPLESLAGSAITSGRPVYENNPMDSDGYRDKVLLRKHNLTKFVAFPLLAGSCIESFGENLCQKFSGVICIYPNEQHPIEHSTIDNLSKLVGEVYDFSVKTDRILLRSDIVNSTITSKDLNSFLHKVIKLLAENWWLEASSVFLHDFRNDTLYMRATTGVNTHLRLLERIYCNTDTDRMTVRCFRKQRPLTILYPDKTNPDGKYKEQVDSDKKSEVYIPIFEPTDREGQTEIAGVFRSINRVVARDDVIETCCHGWEDASILLFVAEVIGVISHLFRRADDISLNFERAMHGIFKPIKAAKTRILSVYRYEERVKKLGTPFDKFLRNSIAYIDALEWQIQKHTDREKHSKVICRKMHLYGPVLSKITSFIEDLHETYNVKKISVTRLSDHGFERIPFLRANEKALQTVFRNLVENAMKYYRKETVCKIDFSWRSDNDFVYVTVSDNGFGIEDDDSNKIFREGYRSSNAMRREPTGTGIGLSDSKAIMLEMGGDLYLTNNREPTSFVVKIQKWR